MSQGLRTLLESATPTLVVAALVLPGGVAYGVYAAHQAPGQPTESVEAGPAVKNVPAESL